MKNITNYILAAAAAFSSLTACQEFEDFDKTIDGTPGLVYVQTGTENLYTIRVVHKPTGSTGEFFTEFPVRCNTPRHAGVKATFVYDASLVESYNAEHKTSYAALPAEYLTLENTTLTVPENATASADSVKVTLTGNLSLLTERNYLAPLRIKAEGIDAVIAEGTESGGHVGEMTTMALVPQVVDAVNVPVIAAGGIADGRQLAAALALGACGVQVGTCLLVSEECPIHENYKAALLKAKDSDTIVTGRSVGAPVRVLKNRMSREYVRQENAGADKMELEKYTLGSLRRAVFEGDTTTGSLMAGQVAGMLHEVRPVADILADLWNSGRQRIAALSTEC